MSLQSFGLARLGRDCELRYTPDGTAVANLSLAFSWGRKGEDGKRQTTWLEGAVFGKRAEALAPYLLKGGLVCVTLEDTHIESFKSRDGTPGTKLTARVIAIDLAGGAPQAAAAPASTARAAAPAPPPPQRRAAPPAESTAFDDMDSDIPFVSASMHFDMDTGPARRMARHGFNRKELT